MKITEALFAEHATFKVVFDFIELALPDLRTLAEVKLLARLVEALLYGHAEAEENLAYVALDHVLAHEGQLDRLHQDHREIDGRLRGVRTAKEFGEARRLLNAAVLASRVHFDREEEAAFPLMEDALGSETLAELGAAWLERRKALVS